MTRSAKARQLLRRGGAVRGNGIARQRRVWRSKGKEKQLQCEEIHFCLFAKKHIVFYGGMFYELRT
nr:MAG TPA: hypothetical protein [Caudoviricetes sp.]